ncbi:MAG TPA: dienelactone hydrolase family protein [Povalibacter sp.]|nr:dienelactone hydrolase family protein [Povalibacter sp.]
MGQDLFDEVANLFARVPLTRRQMVTTSLAAGFALAVQPISAATITTGTEGLTVGEVRIPTGDIEIPGYRAMPAKGGPFAVALVVQEVFGVHEHIRDICRRLARIGYCAIAPELYARQGDVSKLQSIDDIMKIVSQVPDEQVLSDLDATVEFARDSGKGDITRLGITGFCWGGRIVWLYAAHSRQLKAGVAWYGRLVGERSPLTPQQPIDIAANLQAPVLGLYGGKDTGITAEAIEQMRTALKAARVASEIAVFPDAQHGFHADYRPSYNEKAAKEGWARMQAWFSDHGAV